MAILGLDVSSTTTAFTVLSTSGDTLLCEKVKLGKYKTFLAKAEIVKSALEKIKEKHKIERIFIEAPLQAFLPGLSSAKTLANLTRFNGVISWIAYQIFNIVPDYIGASTARKTCGVVYNKADTSKMKTKNAVLQRVIQLDKNFAIEYNKASNLCITNYDRADSFIIAMAGYKGCSYEIDNGNTEETGDSE